MAALLACSDEDNLQTNKIATSQKLYFECSLPLKFLGRDGLFEPRDFSSPRAAPFVPGSPLIGREPYSSARVPARDTARYSSRDIGRRVVSSRVAGRESSGSA